MTTAKKSPKPHHRADRTRDKIIKAAKHLFARHGFAGTSTLKITERAKVPHSLLFHHFTNKQNLWLAVKAFVVEKENKKTDILPDTSLPLTEFISELTQRLFHFYQADPELTRMLNWQRMESHQQKGLGITLSTESRRWIDAFAYYQQQGQIDSTIKPEYIVTMIGGIIFSAAFDPNVFLQDSASMQAYLNFCSEHIALMLSVKNKESLGN
ncbi:TetR/AcrR family transcriptional regulator [Piscirickettsia litoralis]|uniref:HTH tetR-type domain-containing protein n=1 Tax=Piscirickettsia litoralis TaxID=1891921 RepID=A0ABX3A5D5_9GAMM|nr:TetR/AcrR family transcriptional regulator [Piscirickettsia litoralis]ODN43725.1 hypothetical protein BGC07_13495 [Piscirickettsia litoralis]